MMACFFRSITPSTSSTISGYTVGSPPQTETTGAAQAPLGNPLTPREPRGTEPPIGAHGQRARRPRHVHLAGLRVHDLGAREPDGVMRLVEHHLDDRARDATLTRHPDDGGALHLDHG